MEAKRVAVLYYGQLRIPEGFDFARSSVVEYCKRHGDEYMFTTFMHIWSAPIWGKYHLSAHSRNAVLHKPSNLNVFLEENYQPLDYTIQAQRNFTANEWIHRQTLQKAGGWEILSNFISQIYSIAQVCQMVATYEEYDYFILLRTDTVLNYWEIPLLSEMNPGVLYTAQDWINIFTKNILEIYCNLLHFLKEVPIPGSIINPEMMRYYIVYRDRIACQEIWPCGSILRGESMCEGLVQDMNPSVPHTSFLTNFHFIYRNMGDGSIFCRFSPKTEHKQHQWVGMNIPADGSFTVSFRAKFHSQAPCVARMKSHNPATLSEDWLQYPGDWNTVTRGSLTAHHNPFIFLFLDDILNDSEIIIEIKNITVKRV